MEPANSAVEWIRGLVKSGEGHINAVLPKKREDDHRNEAVEILKRLQREAFSDIMKLRDRQEKLERMITSVMASRGTGPFQEARTRLKGMVDVVGALFLAGSLDQQTFDSLSRAGIRTGIDSRFIFETAVRQKDALIAEFVATNKNLAFQGDLPWNPLVLAKVIYVANINDSVSMTATPMGAQCKDFGLPLGSSQGLDIAGSCNFRPPLFNQYHGCAAGLNFKGSNFSASLAELVSDSNVLSNSIGTCLSTFGQFSCQPYEGTRVTFSAAWQVAGSPFQNTRIGPLAMPIFGPKRRRPETPVRSSTLLRKPKDDVSDGSVALLLETEVDDSTQFRGWLQMEKKKPTNTIWALTLSDTPDDEVGWGMSVGGSTADQTSQVHVEGFFNISLGKRLNLQPGVVFAMTGRSHKPAFTLRANWSI